MPHIKVAPPTVEARLVARATRECAICFEAIRDDEDVWACERCRNVLHSHCASKWHRQKQSLGCPFCRHVETPTGQFFSVLAALFMFGLFNIAFGGAAGSTAPARWAIIGVAPNFQHSDAREPRLGVPRLRSRARLDARGGYKLALPRQAPRPNTA